MSCPAKTLFVVGCVLLFSATVLAQAPATIFDLSSPATAGPTASAPTYAWPDDSNTCTYLSGTAPCDYWNELNGTGNNSSTGAVGDNSVAGHSSVRTFISGAASTNSFQGGGSKDPSDLSSWAFSSGPTPNKDTLNAGYAAAYNQPDFDIIFGADRASPNGDANIGIWFFQEGVCTNGATGKFVQCGTTNAAHHIDGDVLVLSAFTGGGGTATVAVYVWKAGCSAVKNPQVGDCAASNLELLFNSSAVCGSADACARTNSGNIDATWATYSANKIASPLYFEGGVNITNLFKSQGIPLPCFASFLEETRSSQSPSAVLKDFLLGSFPVCSVSITKACGTASISSDGTTATFPVGGTVTNTGIGTIYDATVTDVITGGPTHTISVGTIAPGASKSWSDSYSSTSSTSETDTASVAAASSSGGSKTITASAPAVTCTAPVTNSVTVSKTCSTSLVASGGDVHVVVSYSGQVCNTGNTNLTNVGLTDYEGTSTTSNDSVSVGSVTAGACKSYSSSYTAKSLDGGNGTDSGRYTFSDLIVITSATPNFGSLSTISGNPDTRVNGAYNYNTASCPICPAGACAP